MERNTKPHWQAHNARQPRMANPERRQVLSWLGGAGLLAAARARTAFAASPVQDQALAVVQPPRPAPAFSLLDIDGKAHRLADYRGKVVLVNFWATWCPPCRQEMPSIERLYLSMKGRPFEVLALDQGESLNNVFAYMGELNPSPTFPVLLDQHSQVAHAFGVMGIPTTYLIDKRGLIVRQAVGGRDYNTPQIRQTIEALMR
ncbi:TlpA disulfide reductase family protein [Thiomonas sp. FB-Cd]|uniref:TlpA family protein disulfide reductase n=1 Tax=Thiomonas sp. FB-Cd TaxID=1158292 RepID=UPI001E36BD67|nr:TlpA disulfide reductase family protein [Thiomonas sp. FB-Cd]